jgi:coproporphyrinogen III oxidase
MQGRQVKNYLAGLQDRIVAGLEAIDGNKFRRDEWSRQEGGGGISCLIEDGGIFERGGVNLSHVSAETRCLHRRLQTGPISSAVHSRPWACPRSCIPAIPTCRQCT